MAVVVVVVFATMQSHVLHILPWAVEMVVQVQPSIMLTPIIQKAVTVATELSLLSILPIYKE
jgi:hypothetical protein